MIEGLFIFMILVICVFSFACDILA